MTNEIEETVKALIEMLEILIAQVDERERMSNIRAWNMKYQGQQHILKLLSEIQGTIAEALQGYRLEDLESVLQNHLKPDPYRLWEVAGIQDGIQPEHYKNQEAYIADRNRRFMEWQEKKNIYFAKLLSMQIKYLMETGRPRKELAAIVQTLDGGIDALPFDLHCSIVSMKDFIAGKIIEPHRPRLQMADEYSKSQSEKAQKPRGKTTDIIRELALSPEHKEESSKELWPHFFAKLDEARMDPEEVSHSDLRKTKIEYDSDELGSRRSITFGQFANKVSDYRKSG